MESYKIQRLKEEINKALDEYMKNVEFEIDTSGIDQELKELCHAMKKQTFYLVDHMADIFIETLK